MAWPFHQHIANLHEPGYDQDPPPPYGTEDHLLPRTLCTAPNELKRGRGRPPWDLEFRIKRCLIRLFVSTDIPIEHIASAIASQHGPKKRLWVRKFFNELTGAIKGTDKTLKQLRLRDKSEKSGKINDNRPSEEVALRTKCGSCNIVGQEHLQDQAEVIPNLDNAGVHSYNVSKAGGHEDLATASERSLEMCEETSPPGDATRRLGKRPKAARPRLTEIVSKLAEGKGSQSYHIGRCSSVSKPTIASRMSSLYSNCNISTETSEFINLYAKFASDWETPLHTESVWQPSASITKQYRKEAILVNMILQTPTDDLKDEKLAKQMDEMLSKETEASARCLVRHTDGNGTTALHLAVAFGLLKTCGILLNNGADHTALTVEDTCINHFAKPAEKLAGDDLWLYYRIKHCRRHVKKGKVPPVPKLVSNRQQRKRKRDVGALMQSIESQTRQELNQDPEGNPESASFTPVGSAELLVREGEDESSNESDDEPQYAGDLTTSPATTVNDIPSTSHARDFANSSNMRHKVLRRNMKRQTYSSDPHLRRSSTTNDSFATGSTISLRDFDSPYYVQNSHWSSIVNSYGTEFDIGKSRNDDTMHMQEFQELSGLSSSNFTSTPAPDYRYNTIQPSLASHASQSTLQSQARLSEVCPAQELSNAPTGSQQSLIVEENIDSTQDNSGRPAGLIDSNDWDFGVGELPNEPMLYWHCRHGKPLNSLISHCPHGCPQLGIDPSYTTLYNS